MTEVPRAVPYMPGMLVFSKNTGKLITPEEPEDPGYQSTAKLFRLIKDDNIEEFPKVFQEHINNPKITDFFSYDYEGPACNHRYNFYRLCKCSHSDEEFEKVHRHLCIHPCRCANGKRYLALLQAYQIAYDRVSFAYSIKSFLGMAMSDGLKLKQNRCLEYILNSGPLDLSYQSMTLFPSLEMIY